MVLQHILGITRFVVLNIEVNEVITIIFGKHMGMSLVGTVIKTEQPPLVVNGRDFFLHKHKAFSKGNSNKT